MDILTGRRRHLGTDRWISYAIHWIESSDATSIRFLAALSDERGPCLEAPGDHVKVMPGFTAAETAQACVCRFIDTEAIGPGRQPDPSFRAIGRHGRVLF